MFAPHRYIPAFLAPALTLPLPALAQAGAREYGAHTLPALSQSPGASHRSRTRASIAKVGQAWEKAYNAGDAAAVTALYTTDAILMVPGSEPGSTPKAIQALIAADIALGGKLALTTADVVGFGDYALETGSWVATVPDGKVVDRGPYLTFYKKAEGGWKIYRDMWTSSMPAK